MLRSIVGNGIDRVPLPILVNVKRFNKQVLHPHERGCGKDFARATSLTPLSLVVYKECADSPFTL